MKREPVVLQSKVTCKREPLLDLWRGLALVDMAWVHLASYPIGMPAGLAAWIGEYTRFAAGAFVLLSGMTVARVFGPALNAGGDIARRARVRLLRRAVLLVVVGRVVSLAFAEIERFRVSSGGLAPVPHDVWLIAGFGDPGVTGGLLLLYAFLLTCTPALASSVRDGGALVTLVVSFSLYAVASFAGDAAHWPRWTFPWAHWQPFFVVGYVVSPYVGELRSNRTGAMRRCLAAATLIASAVFLVRAGTMLGFPPELSQTWSFAKVPLQPAEMLWYFAASACALSWSGWAYLRSAAVRRSCGWIERLGRWSLLVYVAHLFLELPIVDFLTVFDPSPWSRAAMLVVIVACMHVISVAADRFEAWKPANVSNPIGLLRRALPVAGTVGSVVLAASSLSVLLLGHIAVSPTNEVGSMPPERIVGATMDEVAGQAADVDVDIDVRRTRPAVLEVVAPDQPSEGVAGAPGADDLDVADERAPVAQ